MFRSFFPTSCLSPELLCKYFFPVYMACLVSIYQFFLLSFMFSMCSPQDIFPNLRAQRFVSCIFPQMFCSLGFTLTSKIHFTVTYMYGELRVEVHVLHRDIQLFQHYLLKTLTFPPNYHGTFVKQYVWILFLDSIFYSGIYMPILTPAPHCLEHCSFTRKL